MKILIADDNEDSRIILKETLKAAGHKIEIAANGLEALEVARKSPPDMIISDILMPEMDGFSLCKEVKQNKELRKIPFIFYTATYLDPEDEKLGMTLGASRFIVKPVDDKKFINMLDEVMAEYKDNKLHIPRMPSEEETELLKMHQYSMARKLDKKVRELDLYRRIIRSSRDAVSVIDTSGFYIEQNPAHRGLIGYSDNELSEKTPAICLGEGVFEFILQELFVKGTYRGDLIAHTRLNKAFYMELLAFAVVDEKGHERCYALIMRDVSDRKRAEDELKGHRGRLEELVEERTKELKRMVNLMAGREVRMGEMKKAMRQLCSQLEEAGKKPVFDTTLLNEEQESRDN